MKRNDRRTCDIYKSMNRQAVEAYVKAKWGSLGLSEEQMKQAALFEVSRILNERLENKSFIARTFAKFSSGRKSDLENKLNILTKNETKKEALRKSEKTWKENTNKLNKEIKERVKFVEESWNPVLNHLNELKKSADFSEDILFSGSTDKIIEYQKAQNEIVKMEKYIKGLYGDIISKKSVVDYQLFYKVPEAKETRWYSFVDGKIIKRYKSVASDVKGEKRKTVETEEWAALSPEEKENYEPVPFKNPTKELLSVGTIKMFKESMVDQKGIKKLLDNGLFRELLEKSNVKIDKSLETEFTNPGPDPLIVEYKKLVAKRRIKEQRLAEQKEAEVTEALNALRESNGGRLAIKKWETASERDWAENPVNAVVKEQYLDVNSSFSTISLLQEAESRSVVLDKNVYSGKNKNIKIDPLRITDYSVLRKNGYRVEIEHLDHTDSEFIKGLYDEGVLTLKKKFASYDQEAIDSFIENGNASEILRIDKRNQNYKNKYDSFKVNIKDFPQALIKMNSANERQVSDAVEGTAKSIEIIEEKKKKFRADYNEYNELRIEAYDRLLNQRNLNKYEEQLKEFLIKNYGEFIKIDGTKMSIDRDKVDSIDFSNIRDRFEKENVLENVTKIPGGVVKKVNLIKKFPDAKTVQKIVDSLPLETATQFRQYMDANLDISENMRLNDRNWNDLGRMTMKKANFIIDQVKKDNITSIKKGSKEAATLEKLFKNNLDNENAFATGELFAAGISTWNLKQNMVFDGTNDIQNRQILLEKFADSLETGFSIDAENLSFSEQKNAIEDAYKNGKDLLVRYDEKTNKIYAEHKMIIRTFDKKGALAGSEISSRKIMTLDLNDSPNVNADHREFIRIARENVKTYVIDKFLNKTVGESYKDLEALKKQKAPLFKEDAEVNKNYTKDLEKFLSKSSKFLGEEYTYAEKSKMLNTIMTFHKLERIQEMIDRITRSANSSSERLAKSMEKVNSEINDTVSDKFPELVEETLIPVIDEKNIGDNNIEISRAKLANLKLGTQKVLYKTMTMTGNQKDFERVRDFNRASINKELGAFKNIAAKVSPTSTSIEFKTSDERHLRVGYDIKVNEDKSIQVTRNLGYTGLNSITEVYDASRNPSEYETFSEMYDYFKTEDQTNTVKSRVRESIKSNIESAIREKAKKVIKNRNLGVIADNVNAKFGKDSINEYAEAVKSQVIGDLRSIEKEQVRPTLDKNADIIRTNENILGRLRNEYNKIEESIPALIANDQNAEAMNRTDRLKELNSEIDRIQKETEGLRQANKAGEEYQPPADHITSIIDYIKNNKKIKTVNDFSYVLQKVSMEFTRKPDNLHNLKFDSVNKYNQFYAMHENSEISKLTAGINKDLATNKQEAALKKLKHFASTKNPKEIESKQKLVNNLSKVGHNLMGANVALLNSKLPKLVGDSKNAERYSELKEGFENSAKELEVANNIIWSEKNEVAAAIKEFEWTNAKEIDYENKQQKLADLRAKMKQKARKITEQEYEEFRIVKAEADASEKARVKELVKVGNKYRRMQRAALKSIKEKTIEINNMNSEVGGEEIKEFREAEATFNKIQDLLNKKMIYGEEGDFGSAQNIIDSSRRVLSKIKGYESEYKQLKDSIDASEKYINESINNEKDSSEVINAAEKIFKIIPDITPKKFFELIQKMSFDRTKEIDNISGIVATLKDSLTSTKIKKDYESLLKEDNNVGLAESFIKAITGFGYSPEIRKETKSLASGNVDAESAKKEDWFSGDKFKNKRWIDTTIKGLGLNEKVKSISLENQKDFIEMKKINKYEADGNVNGMSEFVIKNLLSEISGMSETGANAETVAGTKAAIELLESNAKKASENPEFKQIFMERLSSAVEEYKDSILKRVDERNKEINLLNMKINLINSAGTAERWQYIMDKVNNANFNGHYVESEFAMLPRNVWDINDTTHIKYDEDIKNFLPDKNVVETPIDKLVKALTGFDVKEQVEPEGAESGKQLIDWERASKEEVQSRGGVALSGGYTQGITTNRTIDGKVSFIENPGDLRSKDYYMIVKELNRLNLIQKSKFSNKDVIDYLTNPEKVSSVDEANLGTESSAEESIIKSSINKSDKLRKFLVLAENHFAKTGKTLHTQKSEEFIDRLESEIKEPEDTDITSMERDYLSLDEPEFEEPTNENEVEEIENTSEDLEQSDNENNSYEEEDGVEDYVEEEGGTLNEVDYERDNVENC